MEKRLTEFARKNSYTLTGREPLPRHLAVAWGRFIFRLLQHDGTSPRVSLYLRDVSLAVTDHLPAYRAYVKECVRRGIRPEVSRSPARSWWRSRVPDSATVIHL